MTEPAGPTLRPEAIAEVLCKAHGTGQCAALCLTRSSLWTVNGECPEAMVVWGHKAKAVVEYVNANGYGPVAKM